MIHGDGILDRVRDLLGLENDGDVGARTPLAQEVCETVDRVHTAREALLRAAKGTDIGAAMLEARDRGEKEDRHERP